MQVSEEDAKKALNEQYGGEDAATPGTGLNHFKFTKYSNAYMLVYVRKSDWDQVITRHLLSSQCRSLTHHARRIFLPLHGPISCCSNRAFPAKKSLRSDPQHHAVHLAHISSHISMMLGVHGPFVPCGRRCHPGVCAGY